MLATNFRWAVKLPTAFVFKTVLYILPVSQKMAANLPNALFRRTSLSSIGFFSLRWLNQLNNLGSGGKFMDRNQIVYKFIIHSSILPLSYRSHIVDTNLNVMSENVEFRYTSLGCFVFCSTGANS